MSKNDEFPILTYYSPELRFASVNVYYKRFAKFRVESRAPFPTTFFIAIKALFFTPVHLNLTCVEHIF